MNLVALVTLPFCFTAIAAQRHWHGDSGIRPPNHPPPPPPPPPPFLQNVTEEGRKEFMEIVTDEDLTKAEIQNRLLEWANSQGDDVLNAFKEDAQKMEEMKAEMKSKAEQLINNVTKLLTEIGSVKDNMEITRKEETEQISQLLRESPKPVVMITMAIGRVIFGQRPGGFPGDNTGFPGDGGQGELPGGPGGYPGGFPGNGGSGGIPGNGRPGGFPGGPGEFPGGPGRFPGNGRPGGFPGNGGPDGFPGNRRPGGFPGNGGPGGFP